MALAERTQAFVQQQKRLRSIAYRILGNLQEAEEIVQEVYIQWHEISSREEVKSPGALLTTLTTRRSLDVLKSAAKQRETYRGPWLPTPIVTEWVESPQDSPEDFSGAFSKADDPAVQLELSQTLSTAFMLLLERLSPLERAVFVLRQGFDLSYQDIANNVDQSAAYCRQLYQRAQRHIAGDQERFDVCPADHKVFFNQFLEALANADITAIKDVLAEDAISYSDGGGKALAALRPIFGKDKVARLLIGLRNKVMSLVSVRLCTINNMPGLILYDGQEAINAISANIVSGKIQALYMMRNPDKLQHLKLDASSGLVNGTSQL